LTKNRCLQIRQIDFAECHDEISLDQQFNESGQDIDYDQNVVKDQSCNDQNDQEPYLPVRVSVTNHSTEAKKAAAEKVEANLICQVLVANRSVFPLPVYQKQSAHGQTRNHEQENACHHLSRPLWQKDDADWEQNTAQDKGEQMDWSNVVLMVPFQAIEQRLVALWNFHWFRKHCSQARFFGNVI